jgi:hypothetical protein
MTSQQIPRIVTKEKPFVCIQCPKAFTRKYDIGSNSPGAFFLNTQGLGALNANKRFLFGICGVLDGVRDGVGPGSSRDRLFAFNAPRPLHASTI